MSAPARGRAVRCRSRRTRLSLAIVFASFAAASCVRRVEAVDALPGIEAASSPDAVRAAPRDGRRERWVLNRAGRGAALCRGGADLSITADGATSTFAADVDGDGDLDALSAAYYDGRLAWYENAGSASAWIERQVAGNVNGVYAVVAADVDADGDIDVITAATAPDELLWYENDGTPLNGGWKGESISTELHYAYTVITADLDGDGDLDVATASGGDDTIAWFENDGTPANGEWTKRAVSTFAENAYTVVAADLDGDGDLDLLSASGGNDRIAWYQNDGTPADGGWATRIITSAAAYAFAAIAADLDGDGDLDVIASAGGDDLLIWFESDGTPANGGWLAHTISTAVASAFRIAASDLDGDGDVDLAVSSYGANAVLWFESDGTPADGGWTLRTAATALDGAYFVHAADLDGDGADDLLAASFRDDRIVLLPDVGRTLFADGFDGGGDSACWSAIAP